MHAAGYQITWPLLMQAYLFGVAGSLAMPLRRIVPASNPHGLPQPLDLVLHDERNPNLGGHLDIVGWEASPETQDSTSLELLCEAIRRPLVRHLACHRIGLHLLHLRLDEVERQAVESGGEASNQGPANDRHRCRSSCVLQDLLGLRIEGQCAKCG